MQFKIKLFLKKKHFDRTSHPHIHTCHVDIFRLGMYQQVTYLSGHDYKSICYLHINYFHNIMMAAYISNNFSPVNLRFISTEKWHWAKQQVNYQSRYK